MKVPDFVTDEEALLRLLWSPEGFDENGALTPLALRRDDFSGKVGSGMSVNRARFSQPEDLRIIAILQNMNNPAEKATPHYGMMLTRRLRLNAMLDVVPDKENSPEYHALVISKEKVGRGRQIELRLYVWKQIYDVMPLP